MFSYATEPQARASFVRICNIDRPKAEVPRHRHAPPLAFPGNSSPGLWSLLAQGQRLWEDWELIPVSAARTEVQGQRRRKLESGERDSSRTSECDLRGLSLRTQSRRVGIGEDSTQLIASLQDVQ